MFYAQNGSCEMEEPLSEESTSVQQVEAPVPSYFKRNNSQDWSRIREQCLEQGVLWEDPVFKADDSSLFFKGSSSTQSIEWKRPKEIVDDPSFFVKDVSRFDINQGKLGDCWFLASLANLTLHPHLLRRVVPPDQGFTSGYSGIFHFRFWQYGRWQEVCVDDRLPTMDGKLIYLFSSERDEFWSPLLEKAYAKLHGCYEALRGGSISEAMETFTGGLSETFFLHTPPENLFNMLLKAFRRSSLIGCCIEPDPEVEEKKTPDGLVKGHAFSVTCVKILTLEFSGREERLLRVRNPWGNKVEWNGPWSDKSEEWNAISEDKRQELGLTFDDDGEFWISYEDLSRNFTAVEVCSLSPDDFMDEKNGVKSSWKTSIFEGAWVKGISAGGCRNHIDTYAQNPQYRFTLTDADEDDQEELCSVIVGLMQKNTRSRKRKGLDPLSIGFYIYKLKNSKKLPAPLDRVYFKKHKSIARVPTFTNSYQVTQRFLLPPGDFLLIPCTFLPDQEAEYLLRIYTEHPSQALENDIGINLDNMYEKVQPPPPTPQDEKREKRGRDIFRKVAGNDLEVDWKELKEILDHMMCDDELCKGSFSKDDCRSMIAMMDVDRSGKLGFEEFKHLLVDIRHWKRVYQQHAQSTDAHLSVSGLQDALSSAGYSLSQRVLGMLAHRYADRTGNIAFDDFISCAVKLKTMIEYFKDKDPTGTNQAEFTLGEWIIATLYS